MSRKDAIATIKIAGYHNDQQSFMRTYVENRISYPVAIEAFRTGATLKRSGMPCGCYECKEQSR